MRAAPPIYNACSSSDFMRASPPVVKNVQVERDAIEGNILKGVGHYVDGKQGLSILEWFCLDTKMR